ncbi:MAG: tetratricopeptide repeat protein, partial [Acidimicrobiia bacterium]
MPRALNIRTPFVNAGTEGTEFALQVGNAETALWVYEGRVRLSNPAGQLLVASGEAAIAPQGQAPQRRIVVKPRQAVEWALYYPPLLDSRPETYPEALRPAVLAYRRNDLTAAFAALDGVPEGARDARYHTLRAGLLLSVGRVPEAEGHLRSAERLDPKNGTAYALRSVIAVVRNEQEKAIKLAAEAVRLAPGSATPYVARSYAEQSAFEIEKARESLEKAAELTPEGALVWARLAEIELSLGDLDAALEAATRAETLDPDLARTQTVLGFAYLTRIEVDHAKTAFERAMALAPADPLPRLGMGLAKIREGDLDAGTEEIEIAASLDPNNSLVRSYLGKAYYEQKRGGLASSEFEQAKLLDPKDPTPWFYDAIQKQTTNRPVEALYDLQKSIELNNNRAVYRSRLLLDEDLAVRGAALGRIYDELGFEQLALIEGWKSTNTDPTNYSAHRLLSDSYRALPRHEIARVSELLQSQLLQPINISPVQPQLAERDLLVLGNSGPSDPSLNEFNSLFLRNRLAVEASGLVGTNNTLGDEVVQSGVVGRHSYSLGQFHYDTDGFRDNNDYQQDIYNVFLQSTLSHDSSAQIELRHTDIDEGDRGLRFFLADDFRPNLRQEREINTARLGTRYSFKQGHDLLFSAIVADIDARQNNADPDNPSTMAYNATAYLFEVQHLFRSSAIDVIAGAGYFATAGRRQLTTSPLVPFPLFDQTEDISRVNAYVYSYVDVLANLTMTLGVSAGFFDSAPVERNLVNPNIGLTWEPVTGTTVRIAAFGALSKEGLDISETIEPTHVAGFNKFFGEPVVGDSDAINRQGVEEWRYGIGLDQKVFSNLYAGAEVSHTDLDVPGVNAIFNDRLLRVDVERLDEGWDEPS